MIRLGDGADRIAELGPGRPARVGELTLTLEEYFPDFALDEQRQQHQEQAHRPGR